MAGIGVRYAGPMRQLKHACVALVVALIAGMQGCASAPAGPPESMVRQDRLMRSLAALPVKRAARGDVEDQKGLIATEDLIIRELRSMGYTPEVQALSWNLKSQAEAEQRVGAMDRRGAKETTPELAAHVWHNIIVEIKGQELPGEVLILSAHFDAVPGAPGADDDGTGTAGLLEVARVLHGRQLKRTVRLIFFNLEEIGLKGSAEYVRSYRAAGAAGLREHLIGMVSLEMLGFFSDAPSSQRSPIPKIEGVFDPPTVGDFIGLGTIKAYAPFCERFDAEMRKAAPGLKTAVVDFPPISPPDFMRSDHAPFMLAGFPGVMLTDTSNFRNPNYHKPTDVIGTIDAERFALVVKGVAGAAGAIANGP